MAMRQIADEIESNLDFLESTLRDIPDRHQNIRAVFNHSWALLPDTEREAFMKLSVFRGGFTRQAAERVAGASLSMLLRLADKSLLQRTGDGRFQIHELLRRYASEQLEEQPGESAATSDAHADYYATFLARREETIQGLRQEQILTELAAESDNIRAAWRRACAQGNLALLSKSTECIVHYHYRADRFQEGRTLCRQGVESLKDISEKQMTQDNLKSAFDLALAQLLLGQGQFISHLGHPEVALPLAERGVRLFRQIKPRPRRQLALSLLWLGEVLTFLGDYTRALNIFYESLGIYQEIGNKGGQGDTSMQIGMVESYRGNYRTGRDYVRVGARLLEEVGNRRNWVNAEWFLGSIARIVGEFEEARRRLDESMRFYQSVGVLYSLVYILREKSQLALDLGDNVEAQNWLQQGLKVCSEIGFGRMEGFFHIGLGVVARRQRRFEEARQRFETSLTLFRESSEPRGVGMSQQNMGELAFEGRHFVDAERFYRRSLSKFEAIEHRLGVASVLCSLGIAVAVDPQRQGLAREQFQRALSVATTIGATPVSLDALVGLASLQATKDTSPEQAAEWLALVLDHPASKHDTKEKARVLLAKLTTEMGQEKVDEAVRRGEARELDEMLAEASTS